MTLGEIVRELTALKSQLGDNAEVAYMTTRGQLKGVKSVNWNPVYGVYLTEEKR